MKIVYLKVGKRFNTEKLLLILFSSFFILMLVTQVLMLNPSVNKLLVTESYLEGIPLEQEVFLYNEGKIFLELSRSENCSNLKVLLNGDEVGVFNNKIFELCVKNGDVIEFDGTDIQDGERVKVVFVSNNIISDFVGEEISVKHGKLTKCTEIRMK